MLSLAFVPCFDIICKINLFLYTCIYRFDICLNCSHIRYMSTVGEMIDWCASMHMKSSLPDVIIIDDLNYYSSQMKVCGHQKMKSNNGVITDSYAELSVDRQAMHHDLISYNPVLSI